jgi:hypothetical protein
MIPQIIGGGMVLAGTAANIMGGKDDRKVEIKQSPDTLTAINTLGPSTIGGITQEGNEWNDARRPEMIAGENSGLSEGEAGLGQLIDQLSTMQPGIVAKVDPTRVVAKKVAEAFGGSRQKTFSDNFKNTRQFLAMANRQDAKGVEASGRPNIIGPVMQGVVDVGSGMVQGVEREDRDAEMRLLQAKINYENAARTAGSGSLSDSFSLPRH